LSNKSGKQNKIRVQEYEHSIVLGVAA
jgi:hypothetical protein